MNPNRSRITAAGTPVYDPSDDLNRLSIAVPRAVADAWTVADALTEHANTGSTLADDLAAGTIAPDQLEAALDHHLLVEARQAAARGVLGAAERAARLAQRTVYTDAAPKLLPKIVTAANDALATITEAAAHLRVDDTPEAVLSRGGRAAELWTNRAQVDDAAAHVEAARTVAAYLGSLTGVLPQQLAPHHRVLFVADAGSEADLAALDSLAHTETPLPGGPLTLLAASGHALTFVEPATVRDRIAAIAAHEQAEAQRRREGLSARQTMREAEVAKAWQAALA